MHVINSAVCQLFKHDSTIPNRYNFQECFDSTKLLVTSSGMMFFDFSHFSHCSHCSVIQTQTQAQMQVSPFSHFSQCSVIQMQTHLQIQKQHCCLVRTSVNTTGGCVKLLSRAGQKTKSLLLWVLQDVIKLLQITNLPRCRWLV